jgi:hypothetical protein
MLLNAVLVFFLLKMAQVLNHVQVKHVAFKQLVVLNWLMTQVPLGLFLVKAP